MRVSQLRPFLPPNHSIKSAEPPSATAQSKSVSKQERVVALLKRADGATVAAIMDATGWQPHSVRGFISRVVRKKLGLTLTVEPTAGGRVYRIPPTRPQAKTRLKPKTQAETSAP